MPLHIQTAFISTLYELGFEKTLWAFSEESDYGLGLEVRGMVDNWHCLHLPPAEALLYLVEIVSILSVEVKNFRLENASLYHHRSRFPKGCEDKHRPLCLGEVIPGGLSSIPLHFFCLFVFFWLFQSVSYQFFYFPFFLAPHGGLLIWQTDNGANLMGQFGWSRGFPGGSDGKESAAMQETWVRFLCWEDPMEKEMGMTPKLLPGKSHGQGSLESYSLQGCKELDMTEQLIL